MEGAAAAAGKRTPEQVVVHPLVLLSVVDHYNRVAKDTKKRVVGVVLGESYKGRIDATNSFAGAASGLRQCFKHPWGMSLCCHAWFPAISCINGVRLAHHSTVPFEEDDKDPSIWFLDHSYLENMFRMFKKVNGEFLRWIKGKLVWCGPLCTC